MKLHHKRLQYEASKPKICDPTLLVWPAHRVERLKFAALLGEPIK